MDLKLVKAEEQGIIQQLYHDLISCSLAIPIALQIELSTSPMTSAHGIEARGASMCNQWALRG